MYFCRLYANDNQFNAKFLLPTTLSDQRDSDKNMQILHKQHTLLQSNKRKKTKNAKGRRKRLDHMTSKNQMRRVYRLLMSFTRVPAQSDRREESKGLISSSQQKKLKKNKEGHKS
jgi:hypothetical protein